MLVLLRDVLPHDKENRGADQAVLYGAGEEEWTRVRKQLAHDVLLPVAEGDQVAQVKVLATAAAGRGGDICGNVVRVVAELGNCCTATDGRRGGEAVEAEVVEGSGRDVHAVADVWKEKS